MAGRIKRNTINSVLHIRPAGLDDSPGIARVQVDSYRDAYAGILPADYLAQFSYAEQEQDWRDWPAAHPEDLLLVAVSEDAEIAGYALSRPGPTEFPPYDSELLALHVCRGHQRRGVGRMLIAASAWELKRRGSASLMLWVLQQNSAQAFYERLGGIRIGERSVDLGEGEISVLEIAYGWPDIDRLCSADS